MGQPVMTETEQQVRARLDPALAAVIPGPPPLAAIVRDGRRIRVRKRIRSAAGLVAAAALVVVAMLTLPSALSGPAPVPPLTTHYHVTANPPGPHSPPGLIASGRVDGVSWSVRAELSGAGYFLTGVNIYISKGATGNLPGRYAQGDPVDPFVESFSPGPAIQVEAVRTDVTLVRVRLTDGQALSLRPVAAAGPANASLIAFAVPDDRDVLAIEAFNEHGEIGYAVPWAGHTWFDLGRWLAPGRPALPRPQTAVIGSGTAFGHSWSQLVSVGPWGWCGQGEVTGDGSSEGGGGCIASLPPLPAGQYYQLAGFAGGSAIGQSGLIWSAEVASSVALVELTTRSGQHSWVRPHRLGGLSFVSFSSAIAGPQTVVRWAAYNRHHHQLGRGSAPTT
jgi:hypothetical protein